MQIETAQKVAAELRPDEPNLLVEANEWRSLQSNHKKESLSLPLSRFPLLVPCQPFFPAESKQKPNLTLTQTHRHTGTQARRHTSTQAHKHTGTQASNVDAEKASPTPPKGRLFTRAAGPATATAAAATRPGRA